MKNAIFGVGAAVCMMLLFSNTSYTQNQVNVTLLAKAVTANRTINANIKSSAPTTDVRTLKPSVN